MSKARIRGSIYSAIFLQFLVSPVTLFSIYFLVNGVYLAFIFCFAIVLYAWLDVVTSEVIVSEGRVEFRHFFRVSGSEATSDTIFVHTKGGDLGLLPVVEIRRGSGKRLVGTIKKTYFSESDISSIIKSAVDSGAMLGGSRTKRK